MNSIAGSPNDARKRFQRGIRLAFALLVLGGQAKTQVLSVPELTSPPNNATDVPTSVLLDWDSTLEATSYHVQVATSPDFSSPLIDAVGVINSEYSVSSLGQGTRHYWRVRAAYTLLVSEWSDVWSFTTIPEPPPPPVLALPSDGATGVSVSPVLAWDSSSTAIDYDVQVSTSEAFSSFVFERTGVTSTTVTASGLSEGLTYYWRVRGRNAGGPGSWSAVWAFTTSVPPPPPNPVLASPLNGSMDLPDTIDFSWRSATGAEAYQLQVSTDQVFSALTVDVSSLSDTLFRTGPFKTGTRYYWRVRAASGNGTGDWSAIWEFTTAPEPPSPPQLTAPVHNATNVETAPVFDWQPSPGATTYHLQVSTDSFFPTFVVIREDLIDTEFSSNGLDEATSYHWSVRAHNSGGTGAWSQVWSFTTTASAPGTPTLASPPNGAMGQPTSTLLSWHDLAGATSYRVQVDTGAMFSSPLIDRSGITSTSVMAESLSAGTTYRWRVAALNGTTLGTWSSAWSFSTVAPTPNAPSPIAPPDGAGDVPTTVTFQWTGVSGADTYHLQVATEQNFSSLVVDAGGIISQQHSVVGLNRGTVYYWRVLASNASGSSPWSSSQSLTTVPPPPPPPDPLSPTNGATDQPVSLALSWTTVANVEAYHLQVSTESGFPTTVVDDSIQTATSRLVGPLNHSTTYFWRLRTRASGGTSTWSTVAQFTTASAESPPGPELLAPASGSIDQPTVVTMEWKASPGVDGYIVELSPEPTFASLLLRDTAVTSTSRNVGPLSRGTIYYWRVRARSSAGLSSWSAIWSFTTIPPPPPPPSLASPANGAADRPIDLTVSWDPASGATSYNAQVSAGPAFTNPVLDVQDHTATSLSVTDLTRNTTYYWRVSASNNGGAGSWSSVWSFVTIPPVPPPPSLSSPNDGATSQPTTVTVSWDSSPGATSYRVQVSTNADFTPLVVNDSGLTTTSRQLNGLSPDTPYFWRVAADNSGGTGPWSSQRSFTTGSPQTQAGPTLVSPPNGAENRPTVLTLRWNSDPGATGYHVQVSTSPGFSATVYDNASVSGTQQDVGPLNNGVTYYWRVRTVFVTLVSDWSGVWSFTTIPPPPSTPTLVSPANNATNVALTVPLVWNASAGASHYHLQVATSTTFSEIVVEDTGLTATSDTLGPLTSSTTYFWRVRAGGTGGWSSFSSPARFTTAAGGLPSAATNAPTGVTARMATLNATVNANGYSTSVKFQYGTTTSYGSSVNAVPYSVSGSTPTDVSNTLEGLAPNTTYHFRIWASNSVGEVYGQDRTFTTPLPPYPTTININGTVMFPSYRNPSDYRSTDYRIVGIPGAAGVSIDSLIPGEPNKDWDAFWDSGTPEGFLLPFDASTEFRFTTGRAFWLIKRGPWSINTSVPSSPFTGAQEVEIPLHEGWNLITNPYLESFPWSRVQTYHGLTEPIVSFAGSFTPATQFEPFAGYYFFNETNLSVLTIPYSLVYQGGSSQMPKVADAGWRVRITLTAGDAVDGMAWLGVSNEASVGRDLFEFHKPRGFGDLPSVSFHRPEWDGQYSHFAADIRPGVGGLASWTFDAQAAPGTSAVLAFENVPHVPPEFDIYLIDNLRHRTHNLRVDTAYAFTPFAGASRFEVVVGHSDSVRKRVERVGVPEDYRLEQNFPNPFNPTTTILLDAPAQGTVEVVIYNALGQRVRTLHSGPVERGRHAFVWNSRDDLGFDVPTGVYLCRVVTPTGTPMTQKMLLVK